MKLIAQHEDIFWPEETIETLRFTSRVFIRNEEGKYAFLKIVGEDFFGVRNHLETCGGGVEEDETFLEAAIREVKEEIGYTAKNYNLMGCILDRLNPIQRMTCSVFFVADVDEQLNETNRTEEEKILIDQVVWLSPDEAIRQFRHAESKVDAWVHRRDLRAFIYLLENQY
jgi:8-oxo-dGTP pyrophosphatase MutT (NUDIX family)